MNFGSSFGGRYRLEVYRQGLLIEQTGWFDNLITDVGLDYFGGMYQGGDLNPYAHVGTGTSTPAVTDTELDSWVAQTASSSTVSFTRQITTPPFYHSRLNLFRFGVGGVVGTISECGIGTITALFSRSLIQDSLGAPTTLTVTAADELFLYYELRHYIDTSDFAISFTANGVAQTGTGRVEEIDAWVMNRVVGVIGLDNTPVVAVVGVTALSEVTSSIAGTSSFGSGYTSYEDYVAGSHERNWTVVFTSGSGTVNGFSIRTESGMPYSVTGGGRWQIMFSPGIAKTSLQTLTLRGKLTWGRYTP